MLNNLVVFGHELAHEKAFNEIKRYDNLKFSFHSLSQNVSLSLLGSLALMSFSTVIN